MEIKFDLPQVPSVLYMEFDSKHGKSFVVFQDGKLQQNITGITLVHTKDEYMLDFEREIGFTE
jgi:hypothetical protein